MRLGGTSIFVGGPIQALLTSPLRRQTLDVLSRLARAIGGEGGTVLSAHHAEGGGLGGPAFAPDLVTARDFRWMTECDAYVAVLPANGGGGSMRSDGTHVELGWASALRVPCIVVHGAELADGYSHLVRGLAQVTSVRYVPLADEGVEEAVVAAIASLRRESISANVR